MKILRFTNWNNTKSEPSTLEDAVTSTLDDSCDISFESGALESLSARVDKQRSFLVELVSQLVAADALNADQVNQLLSHRFRALEDDEEE